MGAFQNWLLNMCTLLLTGPSSVTVSWTWNTMRLFYGNLVAVPIIVLPTSELSLSSTWGFTSSFITDSRDWLPIFAPMRRTKPKLLMSVWPQLTPCLWGNPDCRGITRIHRLLSRPRPFHKADSSH